MSASVRDTEHLIAVEELLIRVHGLRRRPRYRQVMAEGTGFEARISTMRILRAVDALVRYGSAPSIREVAERLGMEHSNASRAVDECVERKLIVKSPSVIDRRRIELSVTPRGQLAIRRLNERREAVHRRLLRGWDVTEMETLERLLIKLASGYEELTSATADAWDGTPGS
jgi:DNA-binding MarR family transcriptional regulator